MRWPCDWNRPLSKEERAIANRLNRLTKEQLAEFEKEDCEKKQVFDREGYGSAT